MSEKSDPLEGWGFLFRGKKPEDCSREELLEASRCAVTALQQHDRMLCDKRIEELEIENRLMRELLSQRFKNAR